MFDGFEEGSNDVVGTSDGNDCGFDVGSVESVRLGRIVGILLGSDETVNLIVGMFDGFEEGPTDFVGAIDGIEDELNVGTVEDRRVGIDDGIGDGNSVDVGLSDGIDVDVIVGFMVGLDDRDGVYVGLRDGP